MQKKLIPFFSRQCLHCCLHWCVSIIPFVIALAVVSPIATAYDTLQIDAQSNILNTNGVTQIEDESPKIDTIDLTVPADDLWQRMRDGFSMPNLDSPLVADRQAWYLNRPELFRTLSNRSRRYLYYIVNELQKRGMPTELALLPMVESSYNPRAASPAHAIGIWQFIPSTGKNYGLEQNWYLDERRDIVASTNAALDYLQYIYEMHGDWHLALASYNWGEGAVGRAVQKNRALGLPTDYASLNMPSETRYYVPKLQALKNIISDPALFGVTLDRIPNRPYFGTVGKPATMDVSTAAHLAEIPLDEFIALNPAYNRPIMPGSNDSPLLLPADKVSVFRSNLQLHQNADKPLSRWRTYTLKRGDKLAGVAARNNLTLAHLRQLNGLTARSRVKPGFTFLIPDSSIAANSSYQLASLPQQPPQQAPEEVAPVRKVTKAGRLSKTAKATKTSKSAKATKTGKAKTAAKGKRISKSPIAKSRKAALAKKSLKPTTKNHKHKR